MENLSLLKQKILFQKKLKILLSIGKNNLLLTKELITFKYNKIYMNTKLKAALLTAAFLIIIAIIGLGLTWMSQNHPKLLVETIIYGGIITIIYIVYRTIYDILN